MRTSPITSLQVSDAFHAMSAEMCSSDLLADFAAFRAAHPDGFTQFEGYQAGREHAVVLTESELLAAVKAQHTAIDILFAQLIGLDNKFMPSQSPAWPAVVRGKMAIDGAISAALAQPPAAVAAYAANHQVLRELQFAHQIIRNALNLMSGDQKAAWAHANDRDGLIEGGITRAHEREDAIAAGRGVQ
jgi:hypothetical protein